MNRYKREEDKKCNDARKGLTEEQRKQLDEEADIKLKIEELARSIHIERFPEEYAHMNDSMADAKDRSGKNPMSEESIAKISKKRTALGVTPLSESGMSQSNDTKKMAYAEAELIVRGATEFCL